ncbi:MAG: tyrosine-type recombinase/integrase [Methylococcaceae bacterium]
MHDQLKAQSWREKKLGDKPKYTWQQAALRYLQENENQKSIESTKTALRYLATKLNDLYLDDITKTVIDEIRFHKKSTGVKAGTVNRILNVLRAILNAAHEWEWIESVPKVKKFFDESARVRFLTHDEANRLLNELPQRFRVMAKFTLATGLRASNVINLEWRQVDMQKRIAWIDAIQSKSGRAITIPLNDDALKVLRGQIGAHETKVFDYGCNQLSTNTFQAAVKRAGLTDFRWHDLRHTWASWHIQNGTPLNVLKELGGWASLEMVLRYAHLSSEHLSGYAGNVSHDKILSYNQKSLEIKTAHKA